MLKETKPKSPSNNFCGSQYTGDQVLLGFYFEYNCRSPRYWSIHGQWDTKCAPRVSGYFSDDLKWSMPISEKLKPNTACQVAKRQMFLPSVPSPLKPWSKPHCLWESHSAPRKFHWLPSSSREKVYLYEINGRLWAFKQTDTHLGDSVYKPKSFCNKTNVHSG